jgi:hypothetical protein
VFRRLGDLISKKRRRMMTQLKEIDFGCLICPRCDAEEGTGNLHHVGFDIYEREEDAEVVTKIEVSSIYDREDPVDPNFGLGQVLKVSQIKSDDADNPSLRRRGVVIHFYCEQCGENIALTFAQHKGDTIMKWQYVGSGEDEDVIELSE